MTDETTEYEDAVNYRENIESGEINKGGFIPGSKYLKLLEYMDERNKSFIDNALLIFTTTVCETHSDKIKNMPFDEFMDMDKSAGCKYCSSDQFTQIKNLVNKQAEDDGLWFDAETAPEAYLQAELRKLHRLIENDKT